MAALLLDAGVLHIQCPAACRAKGSLPSSSSPSPSCSSQAGPAALLLANMERNKRNGGALVMLVSGGGANSESLRWSSARLCVPLRGSTVRGVPRSTVAENATPVCMCAHLLFFHFFSFVGFFGFLACLVQMTPMVFWVFGIPQFFASGSGLILVVE